MGPGVIEGSAGDDIEPLGIVGTDVEAEWPLAMG